jgi:tetratricopeptide (TPR) repeat protein
MMPRPRRCKILLERWEACLALNQEIVKSQKDRDAPALEVARTRFNDYGPLLGLLRFDEARALLDECRRVFEKEEDVARLDRVFSGLANLENKLGHYSQAVRFEEDALRYKHASGSPEDCAISHNNIASYLERAGEKGVVPLAHRLGSAIIGLQTSYGGFATMIRNLALDFLEYAPEALPFPESFDALCKILERTDGVHFRDLFDRLPRRVPTGDEAMQTVIAMARELAKRMQEGGGEQKDEADV